MRTRTSCHFLSCVCGVLASALLGLLAPWALACEFPAPAETFLLITDATDVTAPEPPDLASVSVGAACGKNFVAVFVARPDGDPDDEDAVGYRLLVDPGDRPEELHLDSTLLRGPRLPLLWGDDSDPFSFELKIVPVDLAGNEGEPVHALIEHQVDRSGCSTLHSVGWLPIATLILMLARSDRVSNGAATGRGRPRPCHK